MALPGPARVMTMINEISRNSSAVVQLRTATDRAEVRDAKAQTPDARDAPAPAETGKQKVEKNGEQLGAMVEHLNNFVQQVQRELQFSIDDDNGEVVIKVVDARSKKVVREIPPEQIREMRKRLNEVSDKLFDHDSHGSVTSMLFRAKA